ncbi:hypothetical protein D3C77_762860 [compost metagenome]
MQTLHRLAQTFGDALCLLLRAILEEDPEFIAAQARQGVPLAQACLEHGTNVP